MKRFWTALAVALMAIFAVAGCNDYGNTFQNNTGALVTFLSPGQVSAGNADFTLTVNGSGFVLKTVVQWNGKSLATTVPVDSTGAALGNIVTATVPAALVAKAGVATVITLNPASGAGNNGLSNPVAFIINPPPNPLPGLAGISPASAVAGSALNSSEGRTHNCTSVRTLSERPTSYGRISDELGKNSHGTLLASGRKRRLRGKTENPRSEAQAGGC